ncbi:methylmalonyl Co-A mutase-associated GTPase MeaB [Fodinicurvata halophila]
MAARDRLGGLADITWSAAIYLRARYDRVIVETVGVGQSETDVAGVADSVVFCVQPGSGDVLQFMKAGIAEIPHVAVVTKADMGTPAHKAESDLHEALPAKARDGSEIEILRLGLQVSDGVDPLMTCLENRWGWLQAVPDRLMAARNAQAEHWLQEAVRARYGREGLKRCGALALTPGEAPFERLARISAVLSRSLPTRVCEA